MMATPFPWFQSLLSKSLILFAGGASLIVIGWPITEYRERSEPPAEMDNHTQARELVLGKPSSSSSHEEPALERPVNLNQGRLEELERLPGIGTILAQRIVEYRERHGPFPSVNALQEVSGIGEVRIEGLQSLVVVSSE